MVTTNELGEINVARTAFLDEVSKSGESEVETLENILSKWAMDGLAVALLGHNDEILKKEINSAVSEAYYKGLREGRNAVEDMALREPSPNSDLAVTRCTFCESNIFDGDNYVRGLGADYCTSDCLVAKLEETGLAVYRLADGGGADEEEAAQALAE